MSAVIYAAIVVMWAVVLVPMWLRRHDAAVESRSVDRFSTAMRTLSRRTHATPGRRYVVMPRREGTTVSVHVSGASAPAGPAARRTGAAGSAARRATLVARRRRTFLGLLGFAALTLVLVVAGVLGWWLHLLADALAVAFVAHLRAQARRTATVSRQRRRDAAAPAPARAPAHRVAPATPELPVEPIVPAPAVASVAVDVSWTEAEDETWQPVPVPPPTYTLKPPAPTPAATAASYAESDTDAAADHIVELDEILERRWAVND